ncbi:hypothetical protein K9M59_01685 [Candidatus Gracilibacteria bacterium]|nr:hypothetical protein [Candidatus Gracilibacteria bacterium]MCF7819753.1 hypothetical protein [Candidatus Gracilibacteria bacterium]
MFDSIFEFIKKLVFPASKQDSSSDSKNTGEKTPPKIDQQPPESQNTTEAKVPQSTPIPTSPPAPPPTPQNTSSPIAQNTISLDEQRRLLEERRRIPGWVLFLKYFSLVLAIITVLGVVWLVVDLDPNNKYLSLFNLQENVGLRHYNLNRQKNLLTEENTALDSKIKRIAFQLENKQYSQFTDVIQEIRNQQLLWFDQQNEVESEIQYGILDSIRRMENYFNSNSIENAVLATSGGNQLIVEDLWATREYVSFGVQGFNLFGKVFFLNTEFVKMMNSFPFFKNGSIRNFAKTKNKEGTDSMSFSLRLEMQTPDEEDPDDDYFTQYQKKIPSFAPQ